MDINTVYRKEKIILNAIELIHEKGIHMVSTKEIAKKLGISESTIFKHFPTKSDLMYGVLEQFAVYDEAIFHTANTQKDHPIEAIIFAIDTYLTYYENYPAITAIEQAYDVLCRSPQLEEKVKHIFNTRLGFIKQMIEEAQRVGMIQQGLNSDNLAVIINSTCRGICLNWRMSDYQFPLRQQTLQVVNMVLHAFRP